MCECQTVLFQGSFSLFILTTERKPRLRDDRDINGTIDVAMGRFFRDTLGVCVEKMRFFAIIDSTINKNF